MKIAGRVIVVLSMCIALFSAPVAATTTIIWTAHPASDDTVAWRGITWSPELGIFVAVGSGTNAVMTSSDGINWTTQATPDSTHIWRGVAWSPTLHVFAAVGQNSPSAATTTIMTSPDGITWTLRNAPVTNTLFGIVWSPEQSKFVTIGTTSQFITSTDGINWTGTPGAGVSVSRNVIWSAHDSQYIATSNNIVTPRLYTSPDGVAWTQRTTPITSFDAAYSETQDVYVVVGNTGIMTSNDGIVWTTQTSPVTDLRAVEWVAQLQEFVAVGPGGIVSSKDGVSWTASSAPVPNGWEAITWSSTLSRLVAVSSDGTNRTMVGSVLTQPIPNNSSPTIVVPGVPNTGFAPPENKTSLSY